VGRLEPDSVGEAKLRATRTLQHHDRSDRAHIGGGIAHQDAEPASIEAANVVHRKSNQIGPASPRRCDSSKKNPRRSRLALPTKCFPRRRMSSSVIGMRRVRSRFFDATLRR
jgi:hypothetical protein